MRLVTFLCTLAVLVEAQYREGTAKFEEVFASGVSELSSELKADEYVAAHFDSELGQIETEFYVYDYPDSSQYSISLLIDPCSGQSYDCCHRRYGTPQYAVSANKDYSDGRVVGTTVFVSPDEPIGSSSLVDEFGVTVDSSNSRFADDEIYLDENCTASGAPYSSCAGKRQRLRRSSVLAACQDNNQTVSASNGCVTVEGLSQPYCVAVGWSQTAFVATCGGVSGKNGRCGTFLELHVAYSNDYFDVEDVLAETQITDLNATGFTTTTLPLYWHNGTAAAANASGISAVACSYTQAAKLVGTTVLVTSDAPVCCCPGASDAATGLGGFMCPQFDSKSGPYALEATSVADLVLLETELSDIPSCPVMPTNEDWYMWAETSDFWNRTYSVRADDVVGYNRSSSATITTTLSSSSSEPDISWRSSRLSGTQYNQTCSYFAECAGVATGTNSSCDASDSRFTFAGQVGRIASLPTDSDSKYGVTFNDGRTVYYFSDEHLQVDVDHNYEVWWVQRTMYNYIVRKRKAFAITSPTCDFDDTNNQYFPYTLL